MVAGKYIIASKHETNGTGFNRQLYLLGSPHPTVEETSSSPVRGKAVYFDLRPIFKVVTCN